MALETGTYISDLVATNPTSTDPKSAGDDHLRLVKSTVKATFPNISGAVTPTHTELNYVAGLTAQPAAKDGSNLTTPATGDSSTKIATTAFVAATAFSSALPAQTGNAGKYVTTNGTTASWASVVIPGTGGQTATGSLTLTASSAAAITVTPATPGLYATLPDATTCTKADNLFAIYNAGDYDYGVKDSAGTQLGWVRARTGAMIGLADLSTAAGIWAYYGLEKTGITASYVNSTLTNMDTNLRRIALDANRTCFLFGGTDCYAIVYDASIQQWGAATLVRASVASGAFLGVLSATNQVLVVSNSSTTAMEAVTLTISGTGITVESGTKATATLAGNRSAYGQLIAVGSSFVVNYNRATNTQAIRAITVSGTTPTIGAESTLQGTDTPFDSVRLFASGSIVRTIGQTGGATLFCRPYTVSGTTLTVGTGTSVPQTAFAFRAFLNGNGNIVCHYINSSHYATIFKLTGTVEAASSVSLETAPTNVTGYVDYVAVSASKTAFFTVGTSVVYCNILTDTSGTASAGTQLSVSVTGTQSAACGIGVSGNVARFTAFGGAAQSNQQLVTYDCSGTSPTLNSIYSAKFNASQSGGGGYTPPTLATPRASDIYGVRSHTVIIAGSAAYALAASGGYNNTQILESGISAHPSVVSLPADGGVTDENSSWLVRQVASSVGEVIQKVEAAA